jgi:hypothetical protein
MHYQDRLGTNTRKALKKGDMRFSCRGALRSPDGSPRLFRTCSGEYTCHASEIQIGGRPVLSARLNVKNGSARTKPAGNLNLGVSRNRLCDFLAESDSRSFSRFYTTNIPRSRYLVCLRSASCTDRTPRPRRATCRRRAS